MPKFISLVRFTSQGARAIKQSPTRAKEFGENVKQYGVEVEAMYWTLGSIDGILILSAEEEQHALRALAELVWAGYVRTETMKAYNGEEFQEIVGHL